MTRTSHFTSEFFSNNRARLRELFTGTAPIVITANGLMQSGADLAFPFKQDANFWYLTGINSPDLVLVIDKGKEYLIVRGRDQVREIFDGAVDFEDIARISGISTVYPEKDGWRQLEARLKKVKHVATLAAPSAYIEFYDMYANPARATLIRRMKEVNDELELLDLREHLARLRSIKQVPEIAAIREAIDITIQGIKYVSRPSNLSKYSYEYEIEADITRMFRKSGASGHSFDPIVSSGKNSCVMHYMENNGQLSADELVLLDLGAEVEQYDADIARTMSLNGQPTRRQQAVHAAVLEALEYVQDKIKPGVTPKEYEKAAEEFIGEKLRELGLIKTIDHEEVRKYFPHAAAHFLGINTHDVGNYELPLTQNMTLACELGIYIPEEGIGVRIEDNLLLTEDGNENLSASLTRALL